MDPNVLAVKTYDVIAEKYAKQFTHPSKHIDAFLSFILKGKRILDVGCGVGVDAGYMVTKGFQVVAVDLSAKMVEIAKKQFPNVDFRQGDMRTLTFDDECFSGVLVAHSLIHIPKRELPKMLRHLWRFLAGGGVAYFVMLVGKSEEVFLPEPLERDELTFLNIVSVEEFTRLMQETGFKLVKKWIKKEVDVGQPNFETCFFLAVKRQLNATV